MDFSDQHLPLNRHIQMIEFLSVHWLTKVKNPRDYLQETDILLILCSGILEINRLSNFMGDKSDRFHRFLK